MTNVQTWSAWAGVLLLGLVCTCSAQAPPQNAAGDLGGTSWRLVRFLGSDDTRLTPEDKSKYTFAFESDGGVSVRIDCNRGHGTWKSSGPNQLAFGPLALTRAMCPTAPLNEHIAKDWQYVRSYIIKDGHLFLSLMADGGNYEFEPISSAGIMESQPSNPGSQATLENTYWKLTRLGDASVTVASLQNEPHFILNSESHHISGSSGCNRLMGSYELNGDQLKLGQMAGTMMACPQGMETEETFLQALGQVNTWKIDGEHLELFDSAGKFVAGFEARHMK